MMFFFFQAEDGIRDRNVTGVQTCALPISAHELRTPLTALHLQTGMLARASGDAERAAAMETLSAGVQRAIRLVEQMLALARQEPRAEAQRVAVRLDDLAREIVAELVPLADAGRIDLGVSAAQPASVHGDPDALRTRP